MLGQGLSPFPLFFPDLHFTFGSLGGVHRHNTRVGSNQASAFRQWLSFVKDVTALETPNLIAGKGPGKHLIQAPHTDEETGLRTSSLA